MLSWFVKISERTLYHGTCIFNEENIRTMGVAPMAGQFVEEMYGSELGSVNIELPELAFAADKNKLQVVMSAMERCIAHYLKKSAYEITDNDIRNYGLIVIFRGSPGSAKPEDTGWEYRDENDEYFNADGGYDTVEPGDYFSEGYESPDIYLKGSALIRFLERNGLIKKDNRSRLIGMVKNYHTNIPVQEIITKVKSLSEKQIQEYIKFYNKELSSRAREL